MAGEIKYEIIEELGVLSESAKGWTKELNLISWNGGAPKYDIRDWALSMRRWGKVLRSVRKKLKHFIRYLAKSQSNSLEF